MVKQIFVNLPVADLKKVVAFFTKLGFKFGLGHIQDFVRVRNVKNSVGIECLGVFCRNSGLAAAWWQNHQSSLLF